MAPPSGTALTRMMKTSTAQIDRTLAMVVLALLLVGCFLVLLPFLTAIIWALILCATIWPLFIHLRERLKGRSGVAALAIVLLMAIVVLAPFVIVGVTIADNAEVDQRARPGVPAERAAAAARVGRVDPDRRRVGWPPRSAASRTIRRGCSRPRGSSSSPCGSCSTRRRDAPRRHPAACAVDLHRVLLPARRRRAAQAHACGDRADRAGARPATRSAWPRRPCAASCSGSSELRSRRAC